MPADSATAPTAFATAPLPLVAAFDGGRLTSDGGVLPLDMVDNSNMALGLGIPNFVVVVPPQWDDDDVLPAYKEEGHEDDGVRAGSVHRSPAWLQCAISDDSWAGSGDTRHRFQRADLEASPRHSTAASPVHATRPPG